MKKSFYLLLLIGCALNLVFTVSCCNKTKTYEELKSDEKKLINKIINEKNISVLSEYPGDGVFGENEFVQLSSGIYLHVADSGNGHRAVYGTTDILIRASGEYYFGDSTYSFTTFPNTFNPFEFRYGSAYTVVSNHASSYDAYYYFFSMGLESVLSYVGDSAIVKLLVPGYSEISNFPAGSSMQNGDGNAFVPVYYDKVKYLFY
ncbi:MAG: DUF4827 domain-containing protein [Tannerella sp.]|jgi:hypothetical protein|nr:DUF4827 domain-containing protein [Tannerella sp.]